MMATILSGEVVGMAEAPTDGFRDAPVGELIRCLSLLLSLCVCACVSVCVCVCERERERERERESVCVDA